MISEKYLDYLFKKYKHLIIYYNKTSFYSKEYYKAAFKSIELRDLNKYHDFKDFNIDSCCGILFISGMKKISIKKEEYDQAAIWRDLERHYIFYKVYYGRNLIIEK